MKIHQRDVVEVNYLFPNGITKPHMAIVISNDDLQAAEDFFYLAMISSKNYNPQYTFPLEDSMLTKNLTKKSFVICQLIGGYTERDVVRICSHVKAEPFNLIVLALINLIRNALQAIEGQADAIVSVEALEADGRVYITITDNGPGISPELLSAIFTPFFSTKSGGSGIGLSISHRIMRLHGGDLTVDSLPGVRTEFRMTF